MCLVCQVSFRKNETKRTHTPGAGPESTNIQEKAPEAGETRYERDAGIDFDRER